jgi:hypothetical protein
MPSRWKRIAQCKGASQKGEKRERGERKREKREKWGRGIEVGATD